jgi:hypothetical protein
MSSLTRIITISVIGVLSFGFTFGQNIHVPLIYLQAGANYGFPIGQTHVPVNISLGSNPLLPIVQGGFDKRPSLAYTFQTGVNAPLSNSGVHGVRMGVGITRRDTRFDYFDYAVEWNGQIFTPGLEEVRIMNAELGLECSYLLTAGRLGVGLGLIGIIWRRQVYQDRSVNGYETRVVSPFFVRLREWYPTLSLVYDVRETAHYNLAFFVALNRRGFDRQAYTWWDGQVGIAISRSSRQK